MKKSKRGEWKATLAVLSVILVFAAVGAALSSYFWHNYGYEKVFSRNLTD